MDKEGADPDRVKTELMSHSVLVEEFGGETQCVLVSAKTGEGIQELLEQISIQVLIRSTLKYSFVFNL